jgi:hypothetical protein
VADGIGLRVAEGANVAVGIDVDVDSRVGNSVDVLDGTEVTVDC